MIIQERLEKINRLSLKSGSHSPNSTFCVMEAVAYVAGETWSDHPECACPVIAAFLRSWNDSLETDADRDRLLKPLVPKLVGTKANAEIEKRRAVMATDWFIRVHFPEWLELAGLKTQAITLRQLPEIIDFAKCPPLQPTLEAIRKDAAASARDLARDAAWDAARVAARVAARDAAWDAAWVAAWVAAWDAARDAAWDAAWDAARVAARDAAWVAARVAARDAAWDAARVAARVALKPTVEKLQASAVDLVNRMIEVK